MNNTYDADYETVSARRAGAPRPTGGAGPVWLAVGLAAFGVILGMSALSTEEARPGVEAERAELVDQIQKRQSVLDALAGQASTLQDDITALSESVAAGVSNNQELNEQLDTLGVAAGTVAVSGPGVTVTTDDAPAGSDAGTGGTILDRDLQLLVNGLWEAGAEAVAVDGHRLTTLSPISFAGEAITVNFKSITPPYVVQAIGNPETLPARLLESDAGAAWTSLRANLGIRFDIEEKSRINLRGDPRDHLRYAQPAEGAS
jgi:uncharacterized protein YlxW (UPF0749 family)